MSREHVLFMVEIMVKKKSEMPQQEFVEKISKSQVLLFWSTNAKIL